MSVPPEEEYDEYLPEEEQYDDSYDDQYGSRKQEDSYEPSPPPRQSAPQHYGDTQQRNKVVNIHATTQLQVVLVKPERFDDAPSIADHLNAKRTVVVNLESCGKEIARRLVDFLSGVAYANNGQLKRVANSTFIITPFNVDIMGDLLMDELESSGLYI
ncbi:MAG TPA: cell division protein SepF [Ruminococcaceae bacterium]|nr:cell division protein SepF [Oscillospiraceae bacterium]